MAKLKIDVHNLHKQYGKNKVLKGISAKFYEGDVVCIIGPQVLVSQPSSVASIF